MIRLRFLLLPFAVACMLAAVAQPYKFGCHYFRNQSTHPHIPTNIGDRDGIHDVIARSDTFNLLHFDIAIDVTNYAGQLINAATAITYVPLIADTNIRFDLIDDLTVDSVLASGAPLTFTHTGDILDIDLPTATVGDTGTLTVYYQGHPIRDPDWGGFYFHSNYIYNLGIGLSTIPPNFGKVWYPCFDSFVERASYTYHVKSAGTFRAHCQGTFLGEVQLGGDTVIRSFSLEQEITTHVSAIAVANYQDSVYTHTGAYGDIPITLTAKPADLNAMVGKFVSLGDAIDAYEFWYGPYPYDRVGYVLTTDGALEIPENVAYPDFMTSQTLFNNRGLFGHELGHHWWGDVVTPRTHNDMWFKEGPAEYSGHLLEEWAFGHEDFIDVVKDNMLYVLEEAHLQDGGFQALSPMPDQYIYGLHTYYKGAAVLHNLRGYLGDTLFRQAMHTIQIEHANSDMDAYEFLSALESATGAELDDFFSAQVFSPGFSVFTVQHVGSTPDGGQYSVDLLLRQRLRGTSTMHLSVPLDLTLIGIDGQRQEYQVTASGEYTAVTVTCAFDPAMAVLTGHARLNQARMDHEFTVVPGQSFSSLIPRTDFRIFQDNIADTTLIRVEHIWSGADQDPLEWGIFEVSNTHYWIVDGLWPEGTQLNGRIYYHAGTADDLDLDLYGASEANAIVAYRETAEDPWTLCPDVTLQLGSLTDGSGNMRLDVLRKGQYAFAKGNVVIGISDQDMEAGSIVILPNPASDRLTVRGTIEGSSVLLFDVFNANGQLVHRSTSGASRAFEKRLDVSELAEGSYVLTARDAKGAGVGAARFVVER